MFDRVLNTCQIYYFDQLRNCLRVLIKIATHYFYWLYFFLDKGNNRFIWAVYHSKEFFPDSIAFYLFLNRRKRQHKLQTRLPLNLRLLLITFRVFLRPLEKTAFYEALDSDFSVTLILFHYPSFSFLFF